MLSLSTAVSRGDSEAVFSGFTKPEGFHTEATASLIDMYAQENRLPGDLTITATLSVSDSVRVDRGLQDVLKTHVTHSVVSERLKQKSKSAVMPAFPLHQEFPRLRFDVSSQRWRLRLPPGTAFFMASPLTLVCLGLPQRDIKRKHMRGSTTYFGLINQTNVVETIIGSPINGAWFGSALQDRASLPSEQLVDTGDPLMLSGAPEPKLMKPAAATNQTMERWLEEGLLQLRAATHQVPYFYAAVPGMFTRELSVAIDDPYNVVSVMTKTKSLIETCVEDFGLRRDAIAVYSSEYKITIATNERVHQEVPPGGGGLPTVLLKIDADAASMLRIPPAQYEFSFVKGSPEGTRQISGTIAPQMLASISMLDKYKPLVIMYEGGLQGSTSYVTGRGTTATLGYFGRGSLSSTPIILKGQMQYMRISFLKADLTPLRFDENLRLFVHLKMR